MTTFEVELEREKTEKIAQVAARGAAIAAELGQDAEAVKIFLHHYFRHVDAVDVDERTVEDLLGLVESHYRAAMHRPAARATITIRTPSQSDDGWTAGGATVVQIVTDDQPFLVDSVTMEVLRQGWSIREVFHPQFLVRRDLGGTLHGIVRSSDVDHDPTVMQESWMHLEILPPARQEAPETLVPDLEQGSARGVAAGRGDGRGLGEDDQPGPGDDRPALRPDRHRWASRRGGTGARAVDLAQMPTTSRSWATASTSWSENRPPHYRPVPATGLGILRADQDAPGAFHALPQPNTHHALMVITKDNYKSRVHRPAYLDYVGVRRFDAAGNVIGERRFIGLFSSTAYSESVNRIPVLRQKASGVLRESGYDEHSHGGKAIMDVLDTYPRDELFQTSLDELAGVVEKVAHLKERRQVRMFVRRDAYGRYLSCLVYLPRDRYTTAVRNRMQEILMRSLGGASIDYTARVTESVLARLHFVLRMPVGESMGEIDIRSLERELTLATRSWNDEFADQLGGPRPGRPAGHPGRSAARGVQGGLHPPAGGQGPRRADRAGRERRHVAGPLRARPDRRRGRPAAQDLPSGGVAVAVAGAAAPLPARRRRDRRATVRAVHGQPGQGVHLRLRADHPRRGRRP